jgi:predicted Rossmann-fold nucleotide-binding protein
METVLMVATLAELRKVWPDLRGVSVVDVDLRNEALDWSDAQIDRTTLLGCRLPPGVGDQLVSLGVDVFPELGGLPFAAYRADVYTYEELTAKSNGSPATLDAHIAAWFASSSPSARDALVRAVHDATIEAAVARLVTGRQVIGIMGGHALGRDHSRYREVARVGRALAGAGYLVATGGGPGVMEAGNLGAWMSAFADSALDDALAMLAPATTPGIDSEPFVDQALAVRARWPRGRESLGVPTWVYADEATGAFATHIAKYFTNSVRENGLLAIARSGVVYAPGGPGTEQEIFTDTAQNSLTLYAVRSPLVFFGRDYFERERPEFLTAARRQADDFGWPELVAVFDEPGEVVAFIAEHDPDGSGHAGVARRRTHQPR